MKLPRLTTHPTFTIAWLGVVAATTLTSAPEQAARVAETSWSCLACGDAGLTDVLLNLLLFFPLGLLARTEGWSIGKTLPALLLLTISIEVAQATLLTGRDPSLSDVLANTSGGLAGWLLLPVFAHALKPSPTFARRAALGVLALTGLIWVLTGFGLQVALSPSGPWVGQPLNRWAGHDPFRGSLQQAAFAGIAIPNDPLAAMPARLDSLDLTVAVTRSDSVVAQRPVSILRVVDAKQQLQLSVSARHRDLQLEHRVRASGWLLRTPTWAFEDAYAIPTHTPWRWHWFRLPDAIVLQSGPVDGPAVESRIPLSLGLGWAFIHPFGPPVGTSAPWWTGLWLGWWMALLGWFGGWVGARAAIGYGAAGIGAMWVASMLTSVPFRLGELLVAGIIFALFALLALHRRGPTRR